MSSGPRSGAAGLFTVDAGATGVETWAGDYPVFPTTLNENQGLALSLSSALQRQLTELELIAAVNARSHIAEHGTPDGSELLVVDGPVRGREQLPRVLGFIKSHQIAYLEPRLHGMVAALGPSERTPVFLIGGSWDRFSWYLRLPGPPSHPWSGIARLECAANVTVAEVVALANLFQAVLPASPRRSSRTRGRRRTSTRWELWRKSFVAGSVIRV